MPPPDRRTVLIAGLASAFGAGSARAAFPDRPIQLVVPFAPAGGTDIAARRLGETLGARLRQSVVIDNRPGANGIVAGQVVVKAPADGHTLLAASLGNLQGGKLKALGVTTAARQPQLPELPTLKEQGVEVVYPGWASIVAPAGLPAETLRLLNGAVNAAMADAGLVARYRELVIEPVAWTPQETAAFMARDRAMLTELVAKTGIKLTE